MPIAQMLLWSGAQLGRHRLGRRADAHETDDALVRPLAEERANEGVIAACLMHTSGNRMNEMPALCPGCLARAIQVWMSRRHLVLSSVKRPEIAAATPWPDRQSGKYTRPRRRPAPGAGGLPTVR